MYFVMRVWKTYKHGELMLVNFNLTTYRPTYTNIIKEDITFQVSLLNIHSITSLYMICSKVTSADI